MRVPRFAHPLAESHAQRLCSGQQQAVIGEHSVTGPPGQRFQALPGQVKTNKLSAREALRGAAPSVYCGPV